MKLTPATVSEKEKKQLSNITQLDFRSSAISSIEDISVCVQLTRLNLSHNALKSIESFKALQYLPSLKWLDLSHNALESFEPLLKLKSLNVLALSYNKIVSLPFGMSALSSLQALMLNNNLLTSFNCSECPISLNTLIVSNNKIQELKGVNHLHGLRKLQLAHNQLRSLPADISKASQLTELRLNDNRILSLQSVSFPPSIKILDLGNNVIQDWTALHPIFAFRNLNQLNLRGNPICSTTDYPTRITGALKLTLLDGKAPGTAVEKEFELKSKSKPKPKPKVSQLENSTSDPALASIPDTNSSDNDAPQKTSTVVDTRKKKKRKPDAKLDEQPPTKDAIMMPKKPKKFSVLNQEQDLLSADHVLQSTPIEGKPQSGLVKVIHVHDGFKSKPKHRQQKEEVASSPIIMEKSVNTSNSTLGLPSWD